MVKSIICRNHQKSLDLRVNVLDQLRLILCLIFIVTEDLTELV